MCKQALDPVIVKKTNQDYFFSMLTFAVLAAGVGFVLSFLKSGSLKTHMYVAAGSGLAGLFVGWNRIYSAKEENMKKTEITLKATTERTWLKSKLPQIEEKLKVAEEKIEKFQLEDFDKEENKDATALRDQLLLLKSYVTSAVGRHG